MPKARLVSRVLATIGVLALSGTVAYAGGGQGGGEYGQKRCETHTVIIVSPP